jgi:hypothetical protein
MEQELVPGDPTATLEVPNVFRLRHAQGPIARESDDSGEKCLEVRAWKCMLGNESDPVLACESG